MSDERYTATVSDLQRDGILLVEDGNHGEYRPRPDEFIDHGVAYIRAADMDGSRVLFESASKISEKARKRITKGIGAPGDILLSHKGTVGKVALVPDNAPEFVCSPQTTFWRVLDEECLNRKYLYAFMRSPAFHAQLATRSGETDMAPYVSLTSQRGLSVTIPPISTQRSIARILGSLDDKIELNRQMNGTLEIIAQAVFKSWFVDFDPVKAKSAGHQTSSLPYHIANLFPNTFEESGIGQIPYGWKIRIIGEVVHVLGGGTPSTEESVYWEGGIHSFCTPKEMSSLTGPVLLATERHLTDEGLAKASSGQLPVGTVLLSSRAPIGYLAITEIPVSINQGIIAMVCEKELPNLYVLYWSQANIEKFISSANGSTFPEISKRNFRLIEVLVPPSSVLDQFCRVIQPMYCQIVNNLKQIQSLTAIRDTLLPRLISR